MSDDGRTKIQVPGAVSSPRPDHAGGRSISRLTLVLALAVCLAGGASLRGQTSDSEAPQKKETDTTKTVFTGEILPVFYVEDVLKSVEYYRDSLGFDFHSYYDYEAMDTVTEWTKDTPAIYAGMGAGDLKFGLHRPRESDTLVVGGAIYYFGVEDVRAHHKKLKERGVDVSDIFERPWMIMFAVDDLDGHRIFFFTRPE